MDAKVMKKEIPNAKKCAWDLIILDLLKPTCSFSEFM